MGETRIYRVKSDDSNNRWRCECNGRFIFHFPHSTTLSEAQHIANQLTFAYEAGQTRRHEASNRRPAMSEAKGPSNAIGIIRYDNHGDNWREVDRFIGGPVEWKTSSPPLPVVPIEGGTVRSVLPGRWLVKHDSGRFTVLTHEELLGRITNTNTEAAHAAGVEEGRRLERFGQSSGRVQDKHGDTLRRLADD